MLSTLKLNMLKKKKKNLIYLIIVNSDIFVHIFYEIVIIRNDFLSLCNV